MHFCNFYSIIEYGKGQLKPSSKFMQSCEFDKYFFLYNTTIFFPVTFHPELCAHSKHSGAEGNLDFCCTQPRDYYFLKLQIHVGEFGFIAH